MTDDMKTKTLDELHQIVAEGEAKKEELERQFRLAVVQSLARIEDQLEAIRYGPKLPTVPQPKLEPW
jgi:hypothetical protein